MKVHIIILSILFSILSCNEDKNDFPNKENIPIHYLKSSLGGCNNLTEENIEHGEEKSDTVIISLSNDTLNIFVGLNYICCAPFSADCNIRNDSIFLSITDTCPIPYQECYCRCDCYYTFDYYLDSIFKNKYYWQIILNDPREKNEILFDKGILQITK